MFFGLRASQDGKLSAISRALDEPIPLKKTKPRLSHHPAAPQPGHTWHTQIVAHAARRIQADTLLVVDPTDIRKPCAEKMPPWATGSDGSTGELVSGYGACLALAREPARRRARLAGRRGVELTLVVVRGLGEEPLQLLTNVTGKNSRGAVWAIVRGYLTCWLVDETIRFLKPSDWLEGLRVLDCDRLRHLVALVLAAACFGAVWLGESLPVAVLASRVTKVAKRLCGIAEFHYDALADGLGVLLSRLGRKCVVCRPLHRRIQSLNSASSTPPI